ncbi:ATP-binding protein [Cryobacterium sp. SO2]|uniref:ATP-binding protein n=1 Tax=Cryobacterium sp. SO2 TaxID=1897060 RepID=UPI00223D98AF|nr:ATP-binding protein [Cryobacterium sp. SO2]WEO77054.1 ATP-binding protein [Cryobacterium sp. SO2]
MTDSSLDLDPNKALGRTFRVDTASVWVEIDDHERLTRIGVGSLIALQGDSASEFLIGLLDRVTRDLHDEAMLDDIDDDGQVPVESRQRDLIRVVLLGTYRRVDGTKTDTFKRGADCYPRIDAPCWVLESSNLQKLMGILAKQVPAEERLKLGHFVADKTAEAVADGNRLFQRHAALLGSTGSGKSWAVALILEKASGLAHPNLVVLDMHGEYAPLADDPDSYATRLRIAGPGDVDTPGDDALFLPAWLLNQEEMQALLLDRSEENAPNQAARLGKHVRDLKREALEGQGHEAVLARFTADSPVPFDLSQLTERLRLDDSEMVAGTRADKQGPFHGKLTRFIARLESRLEDRRYSFMFAPPEDHDEYEWLEGFAAKLLGTKPGIKIIDFSEVPSDVLPVIVGVLARLLYEIHFWTDVESRTPVTLVCDEAHLYMPADPRDTAEARALDVFERIAKEGRKYGVSLLVVSQRPADVSRTVLSQCNNFLVLRLTNDRDQMVIRRLMPDSLESLTASLPLLDVGEALLLGDAIILPTRIKLDKPKIRPASATLDFWTEWSTRPVNAEDLKRAVESMRTQSRV